MIAVLFDVDLTMVDAKRSGSKAMRRAFEEIWGWQGATDGVPMAGRTDRAIFRDIVMGRMDPGPDEAGLSRMMEEFIGLYVRLLEAQLGETPAEACPGIPEVLRRVEQIAGLPPGLATGNFRAGAELKMRSAGIDPGLFAYGAFGEESRNRDEVVGLAIERAGRLAGAGIPAVVVGDTPLDHRAARANGARSALVGTGLCAFSELEILGPEFLAKSLADPGPFLSWLGSLTA
jgi:phosphoglycolate phosphatase